MSDKKENKRRITVYTSICADILHVGHLNILRKSKELGDFLIVGVLTNEAMEAYKRKPIIPLEQRIEIIKAVKYVDMAVPQYNRDGTENLKKFNVDILTRADDVVLKDEVEYIKSMGGKFVPIPYTKGISTTSIIEKIKKYY